MDEEGGMDERRIVRKIEIMNRLIDSPLRVKK